MSSLTLLQKCATMPAMVCCPQEKCNVGNVLTPLISISAIRSRWVSQGDLWLQRRQALHPDQLGASCSD